MPTSLYVVLSDRPKGVTEEEFDRWYESHLRDVLRIPGFVGARRFALDFRRANNGPEAGPFTHAILYEIEGDFEEAWAGLERVRYSDTFWTEAPEWSGRIRSSGWQFSSIAGLEGPDRLA